MSKLFISLTICLFFLLPAEAFAEQRQDIPDWLKRVNYGIDIGTDQKPIWYFETVQPLYQSPSRDRTLFIQPRANKQGHDETYNLGLGYRWLTDEENVLLGLNTFYDYTEEHSHYR